MPTAAIATPPAAEAAVAGCVVDGAACAAPAKSEKRKIMNPSTGTRPAATPPPASDRGPSNAAAMSTTKSATSPST
eukprot:5592287-Prymnesium_polylepis.1